MNRIYQISTKFHEKTGLKETSIFLFINIIFWALLALLLGMPVCRLLFGTWQINGIVLFCLAGYAAVFFGFFGGAIYLYQK